MPRSLSLFHNLNSVHPRDLLSIKKPAQYLGGEKNAVQKNDAEVDLHFALVFPDTYEVGMSHLGLQILYALINEDQKAWAERVFMPLPDMESLLRKQKLPLTSLESGRPLDRFHILGFSLQYELCGTNILAMLELGGITRYAKDRSDGEPLVLGGGPYAYHAEPLAPFFDAFFLGDAEEAIPELLETVRRWKARGPRAFRRDLLSELHAIEGVYVPALFEPRYTPEGKLSEIVPLDDRKPVVVRRLLPSLDGAPFPERPVVPNVSTVHNRLSVEVMRGCVRGCRFCQAGYLYRPQRERNPEEILDIVARALPSTGYEELSLLSLSTADYCSIIPLLKVLMDRHGKDDQVAISFPSTRVDALKLELLEQVQRVRRTGFTIAPEAGTQRLRDVINKGVSDAEILETCGNVFRMGWTGIKLYFMIGLPTETDEDLEGIIDIAARIKSLREARGKVITVSVSNHVPKPHTPFQWVEQIPPSEIRRRQGLLARGLRRIRVNFRYHDPFSSLLEGVFARGDRRVAALLERAYELGARLDGWTEHLNEETWNRAFLECNIDPLSLLRARDEEDTLPWDHLSCGIPKSYFRNELKRALRERVTPDCLHTSCSSCGTCDYDMKRNVLFPRDESEFKLPELPQTPSPPRTATPVERFRIRFQKNPPFHLLGHLELVQLFQRATRRGGLPVAYSRGFHPLPRMSFGPPLQLGIESEAEFCDLFLTEHMSREALAGCLRSALPRELFVTSVEEIPLNAPSLQEEIIGARYRVIWNVAPGGVVREAIRSIADGKEMEEVLNKLYGGFRGLSVIRVPRGDKHHGGTVKISARSDRGGADIPYVELNIRHVESSPSPSLNGSSPGGNGGKFNRPARQREEELLSLGDGVSDVSFIFVEETQETADAAALTPVGLEFTLGWRPGVKLPRPLEVASAVTGIEIGDYRLTKVDTVFRPVDECIGSEEDEGENLVATCGAEVHDTM